MTFDTIERDHRTPEIPERLQRLDRELMTERTKQFDYLNAVRTKTPGMPAEIFRVYVARISNSEFHASAQAVGRVFKAKFKTPSGAYAKLMTQLRWGIDRWIVEENARLATLKKLNG